MRRLLAQFIPFIFLGVILVLLITGLIFFSYLLILGAMLGFILFMIQWIREKLTRRPKKPPLDRRHTGRTIEHDDE